MTHSKWGEMWSEFKILPPDVYLARNSRHPPPELNFFVVLRIDYLKSSPLQELVGFRFS